jgi:GNAT superfamily N-acetyltransferase
MPSSTTIAPACDLPTSTLIDLINAAFDGYIGGQLTLDRAGYFRLLHRQQIDLALSRVAMAEGRPLALAGVSRRGWRSRLAIMGVHPDAAGRGIATRLTQAIVADAAARGDRRYELEVIEQNPAAVRVYIKAGFRPLGRLVELRRPAGAPTSTALPERIDVAEAAALVGAHSDADTPWPLSGPSLATLGPPAVAWRLGDAWAIAAPPSDAEGDVRLLALVVHPSGRGRGASAQLLRALLAAYPSASWHVPANCPERYAPLLERYGFERGPLSQLHMARDLQPPSGPGA